MGQNRRAEPRVHYPKERSKAKVVEHYQYTSALMREQLKLFFAQLFLSISSVFTEQSQICVKNTKPFTIERATRCERTIEFLIRARRDQNRSTFGL